MKKWAISAVVYLLVVIGGYLAYDALASGNEEVSTDGHSTGHQEEINGEENEPKDEHGDDHGEHSDTDTTNLDSEVTVHLNGAEGKINLSLVDTEGNAVEDLEVNHEKLLHLIVVSEDLETYVHLHPDEVSPGTFETKHDLPEGEYKAFVDIKPKKLAYHVGAIPFTIGEEHGEHGHGNELEADTDFTKIVDNHTVTMEPTSLKSGEEITLQFDLNGDTPEPYLGALGHVVILDEMGEEYIHVHPLEGDEPVFATSFRNPGIYKIWAEFQFNGKVFVFPYIVEIQ
ncbi:hypothetical protein GCM10008967_21720 [Bacillus carboniphilus]|uniref:Secreted protein n=1 Tax=Bacillus carboniphilus TaxID=86663 RepID=A0ABP3FZA5_9BACI